MPVAPSTPRSFPIWVSWEMLISLSARMSSASTELPFSTFCTVDLAISFLVGSLMLHSLPGGTRERPKAPSFPLPSARKRGGGGSFHRTPGCPGSSGGRPCAGRGRPDRSWWPPRSPSRRDPSDRRTPERPKVLRPPCHPPAAPAAVGEWPAADTPLPEPPTPAGLPCRPWRIHTPADPRNRTAG